MSGQLPSRQGGHFWAPIRGQYSVPIDTLAASMSEMPARRSSFTSRSCSVRFARSTRPLAWELFAQRISMLSSFKALPKWVIPWPDFAASPETRNTECLSL